MPPAARISDMHTCPMVSPGPVPHVGGPVITGAPTVIVAGMPQARISDQCTCAGPPDVIVKGSPTVIVAGMPAARIGDTTAHGGVIVTGAPNVLIGEAGAGGAGGMSPAATPRAVGAAGKGPDAVDRPDDTAYEVHKKRLGGDDNVDVMFAEAGGSADTGDGRATAQGEVALGGTRMDHAGHMTGVLGGSHKLQAYTADAKVYGSVGKTGGGAEAATSARMVEQEGSIFAGKDENNPFSEIGAGYALMKAEAKGDVLLGSDGRRAGLSLGGKVGASAAEGDIKSELNFRIPLTDWTFSARGKLSGDAGSVGVGGGAHAYKDLETERYHVGAFGEVAAFLGLGGDVDFSIGPPYNSRDRRH